MRFKGQDISLIVGGVIFLLTSIMGITSGVGIIVVLFRSALAAIVLSLLTYGFTFYLKNSILPSLGESSEKGEVKETGTLVDLSAGAEEDLTTLLQNDNEEKFVPFAPQQINPNLKEMIENNPEQAAEVVRKMGLDQ